MDQGFGTWQFSEEAVPKVEEFVSQCRQVQDCDPIWNSSDPRYILFTTAYQNLPPIRQQPVPELESDDESSDEEKKHRHIPTSYGDVEKLPEIVDLTSDQETQQPGDLAKDATDRCQVVPPQEPSIHSSQLDESALLNNSQGLQAEDTEENTNTDGLAEQIELLESEPTEIDLSTLPTNVVIQIFSNLSDKGLSHAVDAVCAMKPTDQARFNSVIVKHLLLPRLHQSNIRCTRHVLSALDKFTTCCPVLSCQQFVAPLIIAIPPQHIDSVQYLVKQIKSQQHKELVLKSVLEGLSSLSESHLPVLCLLIGPSGNMQMKQQLIKVLAESVDKFPNSIHFGKLLLAVIPLVQAHTDLKTQLTDVVNRHQSVVKKTVLARLSAT